MLHTNKILGYTIILYPESAPTDWTMQLEQLRIAFTWCLHDKDDAKPHIHVFILGDYPKKKLETIRTAFSLPFLDKDAMCEDTQDDPQELFCELVKLIDECGLYEYADLISYLVSQGDKELLKVARGRDVRDYVTSRRYAVEKGRSQARKRTLLADCPPKPIEGKPIPINSNEDYNPFLVSDKVDTSSGDQH